MHREQQTGIYSREGIEPVPGGAPDWSERAPFHLFARYGVEAGVFLSATIAITHPTSKFRRVMRPQVSA